MICTKKFGAKSDDLKSTFVSFSWPCFYCPQYFKLYWHSCSISYKLSYSVISLAHTLIQDLNLPRFGVVQFKEICTHMRFATDLFDCDMLRCVLIFHGFVRCDGFLSICGGYNLMKCLSLFYCSAVLEIFLRQYLPQSLLKWREPYLVPSKNLPTEVCLLSCKN